MAGKRRGSRGGSSSSPSAVCRIQSGLPRAVGSGGCQFNRLSDSGVAREERESECAAVLPFNWRQRIRHRFNFLRFRVVLVTQSSRVRARFHQSVTRAHTDRPRSAIVPSDSKTMPWALALAPNCRGARLAVSDCVATLRPCSLGVNFSSQPRFWCDNQDDLEGFRDRSRGKSVQFPVCTLFLFVPLRFHNHHLVLGHLLLGSQSFFSLSDLGSSQQIG